MAACNRLSPFCWLDTRLGMKACQQISEAMKDLVMGRYQRGIEEDGAFNKTLPGSIKTGLRQQYIQERSMVEAEKDNLLARHKED